MKINGLTPAQEDAAIAHEVRRMDALTDDALNKSPLVKDARQGNSETFSLAIRAGLALTVEEREFLARLLERRESIPGRRGPAGKLNKSQRELIESSWCVFNRSNPERSETKKWLLTEAERFKVPVKSIEAVIYPRTKSNRR